MAEVSETCPKCGEGEPNAGVRQGPAHLFGIEMHVVDLAYRCRVCEFEWGFDPDIEWMEPEGEEAKC